MGSEPRGCGAVHYRRAPVRRREGSGADADTVRSFRFLALVESPALSARLAIRIDWMSSAVAGGFSAAAPTLLNFRKDVMSAGSIYDDVPYTSHAFAQSHPRRLATVAHLQGFRAAPFQGCRVLELGCAAGGNLLPMALDNPAGEFVGLDRSARSIAEGRAAAEELGIRNATLDQVDLTTWHYEGPPFDYIVAHGLYSWVAPEVQERILEICHEHLAPRGIAYVSYNTQPGWSLRGAMRDFLRFGTDPKVPAVNQMRGARELLDLLARALPPGRTPQAALVHNEVQRLVALPDDYLLHEFLAETNSPLYFRDFLEHARRHELQYLGEAEYSWMTGSDLPPDVAESLRQRSRSTEEFEQYLDFVRWQLFRQTLLCHAGPSLTRMPPPERLFSLWVAAEVKVEGLQSPLGSNEVVTFQRPKSRMASPQPATKAALVLLAESWPKWWKYEDLLRATLARLGVHGLERTSVQDLPHAFELADTLRRAYGIALVELATEPPRVAAEVAERPQGGAWAIRQAKSSPLVTNQLHGVHTLTGFQRFVLGQLDGRHDREQLVDALENETRGGVTLTDPQGNELTDRPRIRAVLRETLDRTLLELSRMAFFAPTGS